MEPTDALRSIETALRLLIREILGEANWLQVSGAPDEARLRERRADEERRRDGAVVSNALLDYTETHHLTRLIQKNWEEFQPALRDKARTLAYFSVIEDVRNSIAHSRDLVPFERELISGIAGQLRNQVSLFRSGSNPATRYYPKIESVKDSYGREGERDIDNEEDGRLQRLLRLEVGDVLTFTGSALNARGKTVKWRLGSGQAYRTPSRFVDVGAGDSVAFEYIVSESDVREHFGVTIRIAADSRYHRYMESYGEPYDDERYFYFAVNPPDEG